MPSDPATLGRAERGQGAGGPRGAGFVLFARADSRYFSGVRGGAPAPGTAALRHVGIYAYRREALLRFAALAPRPLERAEGLEQLRALENGMGIGVVTIAPGTGGRGHAGRP